MTDDVQKQTVDTPAASVPAGTAPADKVPRLRRCLRGANTLGVLFMLPAAALLLVFLTYPLGLGVWLGFTDTTIGRAGHFIGVENYQQLWTDTVFWLSVFNTVLYTVVASHLQIRPRPVAGAAAERAAAVQGLPSRHRALALGGADRAFGHRLLVDLRRPVLDHLLGADPARADRHADQLPRRLRPMRAPR